MKPTGDEACSAIPSSHSLQGFDGLLPDRQPVHGIHALDHIIYGVALYSRQILSLYVNQWNGVLAAAARTTGRCPIHDFCRRDFCRVRVHLGHDPSASLPFLFQ